VKKESVGHLKKQAESGGGWRSVSRPGWKQAREKC